MKDRPAPPPITEPKKMKQQARGRCVSLAVIALLHGGPMVSSAWAATATYANARYGYRVSYPADLLVAEPESDSGDGRKFHARRGHAELLAWASENVLEQTPADLARHSEHECGGRPASYKIVKPTLVAVSCVSPAGIMFYQKTLIRGGVLTAIRMTYPAAERSVWDGVVTQISRSMAAGIGE